MKFHAIVPSQAETKPVPVEKRPQSLLTPKKVLFWLSGLTCTDENVVIKSGIQRAASKEGVIIICPDTSPRGIGVADESKSWDFGVGSQSEQPPP
jgi:S-formylglutathione hydrolase